MLIYYITGQLLAVSVNSAQIKASKAASSNAIPTALGIKAGIPKQRLRKEAPQNRLQAPRRVRR